MRQLRRAAGVLLAAVAWMAVSASPTVAAEKAQPRAEYAPTMLVLDASGSMADADPAGGTKMDAAKRATRTLIDAVPDGAQVGLTVYGTNTGSAPADKEAGCRDVTVLRGPEPIDKPAMAAAVDGLRPRGYTPIGTSLRVAADSLPKEGPRSIVLVSDGIDTCAPPDPCDVAKELSAAGVDLVVHAVGFGVDEPARRQLTCIAQTTGGTYTDAPDAKSLDRVLPRVTGTALRNYQPAGIPVTGAPEQRSAPELRPGQYLDVIERNRPKYYAVDVPDGMTAYFTATLIYSRTDSGQDLGGFETSLYTPDGRQCGFTDRDIASPTGDGEVITTSMTSDGGIGFDCDAPGRYAFRIQRDTDQRQPDQLPVEIIVGLEPQVSGDKGQPADTQPVSFRDPGGSSRPVVGGGSFGTSATLDGAGSYTDRLRYGEYVFYRVHLDWGQGLAYRVRYGDVPERPTVNVETTLFSPFRTDIGYDTTVYGGTAMKLPAHADAIATSPIRYLNREAGERDTSVAGWHYIAVKLGHVGSPGSDEPVPVSVDLSVTGQPEPGPEYDFASEEAREAGVFGQGEPRPTKAGPTTPGAQRVAPAAQGSRSSLSTAWVLGGGAAGVLVLAVTIALVVLRRRHRQP